VLTSLAVEIVLANGDIRRVSSQSPKQEDKDIFWAIRGAGASFGIITEFKVRTEPAPAEMVEYRYSFTIGSWQDMAEAFKTWQAFIAETDLPREFASQATITPLGLVISGTFYGTEAEFDKFALKSKFPIRRTGDKTLVLTDYLGLLGHWAEEVALQLGGGIPARAYTKTLTFSGGDKDRIPDAVVDEMFKYIETVSKGTLIWFIIFDLAGGAVNDPPMDATAFAHRDALFYLQAYAISDSLIAPVSTTTKDFLGGLTDLIVKEMTEDDGHYKDYGAYPGYVDLEIKEPQKAYWRSNLPRLQQIKGEVDPKDVFHNPQSVRPNGKDLPYVLPEFVTGRNASFWAKLSALLRV
jgi:FAD/FMN-containing dehydrogenase